MPCWNVIYYLSCNSLCWKQSEGWTSMNYSASVLSCFRRVWLSATSWTVALKAPLFMGFSRQEYWSGLPCPSPGDLPEPWIQPGLLCLLHCRRILYCWVTGEALDLLWVNPYTLGGHCFPFQVHRALPLKPTLKLFWRWPSSLLVFSF